MSQINHFKRKYETTRMLYTDVNACHLLSNKIISWFPKFPREYVVACIGTDRSTGDALGPLTGSFFSEKRPRHMTVYGTLKEPMHATNMEDYLQFIHKQHKHPFIIAIDACLGKTSSVGYLIASEGPLKPGAALNKPLPAIGDIHLTGVVNISGFMEYTVLQNTRLSTVVDMAKQLAHILDILDKQLTHQHYAPAIVSPKSRNISNQ